jgi:7-cyano-7-deazaguanine synthase
MNAAPPVTTTQPLSLDRPIRHAMAVCSGGIDSTTLAYWLSSAGARLTMVSADYGQRHRKELRYARGAAAALGAEHRVVDLRPVGRLLGSSSALTDPGLPVPDGHYTDVSMAATVVPNRNALLLDVAVGMAAAAGADVVAFGAHSGDHAIYPDCRPAFLTAYQAMVHAGCAGVVLADFAVIAPFLHLTKTDIVRLAIGLGVPLAATWSCYRGRVAHCGTCGTCVERREAFAGAGVDDPTIYESGQSGELGGEGG